MYPNQFQNPYAAPTFVPPFPQITPPSTQVVRVKGRPGADAYNMGPNSSALLLDESGTLVWLVTTDGAGYKTVAPYDITPHQDAPAPDFGSLENRISKLEGIVNEYTSNLAAVKRSSDTEPVRSQAADEHGERGWKSASPTEQFAAK